MADESNEFEFEYLEGELVEKFLNDNESLYGGAILKISPSNCCLPASYRKHVDKIRSFQVRPDDVWIVTYPKCGTTWTQEMAWLLVNNLDFETAKKVSLTDRSPFLEFGCLRSKGSPEELKFFDTVRKAEELKSPRCIKSHLPLALLPKQIWTVKPKVVYVARGAKDAAVSFYHHHRLFSRYTGTPEDFSQAFMAGIVGYGSIWDHILEFWKIRHESHVLFNTFEEMKKDLPGVVLRTAKFLNRDVNSEQLKQLCEHLSFESMKNNPMVSHEDEVVKLRGSRLGANDDIEPFMRKGTVGSWKSDLTPELADNFDKWSREQLKGEDYPFTI